MLIIEPPVLTSSSPIRGGGKKGKKFKFRTSRSGGRSGALNSLGCISGLTPSARLLLRRYSCAGSSGYSSGGMAAPSEAEADADAAAATLGDGPDPRSGTTDAAAECGRGRERSGGGGGERRDSPSPTPPSVIPEPHPPVLSRPVFVPAPSGGRDGGDEDTFSDMPTPAATLLPPTEGSRSFDPFPGPVSPMLVKPIRAVGGDELLIGAPSSPVPGRPGKKGVVGASDERGVDVADVTDRTTSGVTMEGECAHDAATKSSDQDELASSLVATDAVEGTLDTNSNLGQVLSVSPSIPPLHKKEERDGAVVAWAPSEIPESHRSAFSRSVSVPTMYGGCDGGSEDTSSDVPMPAAMLLPHTDGSQSFDPFPGPVSPMLVKPIRSRPFADCGDELLIDAPSSPVSECSGNKWVIGASNQRSVDVGGIADRTTSRAIVEGVSACDAATKLSDQDELASSLVATDAAECAHDTNLSLGQVLLISPPHKKEERDGTVVGWTERVTFLPTFRPSVEAGALSPPLPPIRRRCLSDGVPLNTEEADQKEGDGLGNLCSSDDAQGTLEKDVRLLPLKPPAPFSPGMNPPASPTPSIGEHGKPLSLLPGHRASSLPDKALGSPMVAWRKGLAESAAPVRGIWKRNSQRAKNLLETQRKRRAKILADRAKRVQERQKMRAGREKKRGINPIIVPANHPFKMLWDVLTVLLTFVSAVKTHQSIRDRTYDQSPFVIFMECWFLTDMLLNFVTEHKTSDGQIIRDGKAVWARYLTTWFVIDALSLVPWEHIYVKPIVEMQKRRNIFVKTFFRSKAVVKVSRIIRGRHIKLFGKVASQTKMAGVGANRLLRLIIKYIPKYLLFYRNMRSVLVVRTLRQIHFVRKVSKVLWVSVQEKKEVLVGRRARERRRKRSFRRRVLRQFVQAAANMDSITGEMYPPTKHPKRSKDEQMNKERQTDEDIDSTVDIDDDEDVCNSIRSRSSLSHHIGELELNDSMDVDSLTGGDGSVDLDSTVGGDSLDMSSSVHGDCGNVVGFYDEEEDDIFLSPGRRRQRVLLESDNGQDFFPGYGKEADGGHYGLRRRKVMRKKVKREEDDGCESIEDEFFTPMISL